MYVTSIGRNPEERGGMGGRLDLKVTWYCPKAYKVEKKLKATTSEVREGTIAFLHLDLSFTKFKITKSRINQLKNTPRYPTNGMLTSLASAF